MKSARSWLPHLVASLIVVPTAACIPPFGSSPHEAILQANEIAAMVKLQQLSSMQEAMSAERGRYLTIEELKSWDDIDADNERAFGDDGMPHEGMPIPRSELEKRKTLYEPETHGYRFDMSVLSDRSGFTLTATPTSYGLTGRRSFYVDEQHIIRGRDKKGAVATSSDPAINEDPKANERLAWTKLRAIYTAEQMLWAERGRFASLDEINELGILGRNSPEAQSDGYRFVITVDDESFLAHAIPVTYPTSGRRSFCMAQDGELRGADKHGAMASLNDPVIEPLYEDRRDYPDFERMY